MSELGVLGLDEGWGNVREQWQGGTRCGTMTLRCGAEAGRRGSLPGVWPGSLEDASGY